MDTRGRWQRSASSVAYWLGCLVLEVCEQSGRLARSAWRRWRRSRARARAKAAHRRHEREKWERLASWQRDIAADLSRLDRRR